MTENAKKNREISAEKILDSMEYIDDDLLTEADRVRSQALHVGESEEKDKGREDLDSGEPEEKTERLEQRNRNKNVRKVWMRWGALAACFVLVVVAAQKLPLTKNSKNKSSTVNFCKEDMVQENVSGSATESFTDSVADDAVENMDGVAAEDTDGVTAEDTDGVAAEDTEDAVAENKNASDSTAADVKENEKEYTGEREDTCKSQSGENNLEGVTLSAKVEKEEDGLLRLSLELSNASVTEIQCGEEYSMEYYDEEKACYRPLAMKDDVGFKEIMNLVEKNSTWKRMINLKDFYPEESLKYSKYRVIKKVWVNGEEHILTTKLVFDF